MGLKAVFKKVHQFVAHPVKTLKEARHPIEAHKRFAKDLFKAQSPLEKRVARDLHAVAKHDVVGEAAVHGATELNRALKVPITG